MGNEVPAWVWALSQGGREPWGPQVTVLMQAKLTPSVVSCLPKHVWR